MGLQQSTCCCAARDKDDETNPELYNLKQLSLTQYQRSANNRPVRQVQPQIQHNILKLNSSGRREINSSPHI
eukprot:403343525